MIAEDNNSVESSVEPNMIEKTEGSEDEWLDILGSGQILKKVSRNALIFLLHGSEYKTIHLCSCYELLPHECILIWNSFYRFLLKERRIRDHNEMTFV